MRKNILDLNHLEANKFFLNSEIYVQIELPIYYSFENVLSLISKELKGKPIDKTDVYSAKNYENVNHIIYSYKDNKYGWRKLELINPYLYVSLVNLITEKDSWEYICKRLKKLQKNKSILCMSMPVYPDYNKTQKASQIIEWINLIERESIKLALDYEYLFQTDIGDCYRSIYTHSVSWALHDKTESKLKRKYSDLLGNQIDHHLQAMSYGQTNGIPQGSILMAFIAEIVLAFADQELFKKIKENPEIKRNDYHILRYRDDYRIFVRKSNHGEFIMKALSETLADLGMTLNTVKTKRSEEVIVDSVKPDKLATIYYSNFKVTNKIVIRNELLKVYKLGKDYPNSGSIKRILNDLDIVTSEKLMRVHSKELISILANIAFENPSAIYIVIALISKAIKNLKKPEKKEVLNSLFRKFRLLQTSGHLEVWLQRLTIAYKFKYDYKEKLCAKTSGKKIKIFNTRWITNKKIKQIINKAPFVNRTKLKTLTTLVGRKEVEIFPSSFY